MGAERRHTQVSDKQKQPNDFWRGEETTPPNGLGLTIWFGRGNLGKLTVGGHPDVIPSIHHH